MAKTKAAAGSGTIRHRPDGLWEGRIIIGYDPGTGKAIRKSVYGKTQREVRTKISDIATHVDIGNYREPVRMLLGAWLDLWVETYCEDLKPMTLASYHSKINTRIKPKLGAVPLSSLSNIQIQQFYNFLKSDGLSPKSIQNIHGILHKSLAQAVVAGVLDRNPSDGVKLPKVAKPELMPLMDNDVYRFLVAAKGDPFEVLYKLALFSGLRQSELLALTWTDIDLDDGILSVSKQLQKVSGENRYIVLDQTKNGHSRSAVIAPSVCAMLRKHRAQQAAWQMAAGPLWCDSAGLVFTNEIGEHLRHHTVYNHFKAIVKSIGLPGCRFHDLRHSYAINALQSGDSIKAVQEQLGHYSSAFTMDTYAAVSNKMQKDSQDRMEHFIQSVTQLG